MLKNTTIILKNTTIVKQKKKTYNFLLFFCNPKTTPKMKQEDYKMNFIISDESLNRYKYRVLTDGIDLSEFEANPVAFLNHNTDMLSIGKWSNLKKENGKLTGMLEFDQTDELAVKIYNKYKNNYMRGVSIHFQAIEESDVEALLLPGQKYPTVTKCKLLEISLVSVPGNGNAVKLLALDGKEYQLNLITKTEKKMDTENSEDEKTIEQLKAELLTQKTLNADNLIALHRQRNVIADGEVDGLKKLAISDFDTIKSILEARESKKAEPEKSESKPGEGEKALQAFVQGMNSGSLAIQSDERAKWSYLDYFKKDPNALELMAKSEPEKFNKLIADFEAESKALGVEV
jgi:phage head maturation protease